MLLQRHCRARVGEVEVLVFAVEVVVSRQRLVPDLHLSDTHTPVQLLQPTTPRNHSTMSYRQRVSTLISGICDHLNLTVCVSAL